MLRDYQFDIIQAIRDGHSEGDRNVIGVMPCRSGKTVCMSRLAAECDGPNIAMAHRQELIAQMSLTFARNEIPHRIVAPDVVIQGITALHHEQFGRSWWRPNAPVVVASVDSLKNSDIDLSKMKLWQTDEAHHLILGNKWGRVIEQMPQAYGVGWSATPLRLDKKSLKRGKGGVFDRLVTGPSMRELIGRGYITDYRIYGVPNALNMDRVKVTSGGEFDKAAAHEEVKAARITGNLVEHYRRLADGMTAVTFAVDVELAHEHAQAFKDAGMPAAVISAKTAGAERRDVIRAVKGGTLHHVVNVDILGEGVDFPACEAVIMARPTMSYGLYVQTFCRCLTPDATNPDKIGVVIDHVGNVVRHGLVDAYRTWTLDTPPKREVEKATLAIQVCGNEECMQVYESFEPCCPFCGWERLREEGGGRERPEMVDGDLTLYGPELLAELRGEVQRIAGDACIPAHLDGRAAAGAKRQWDARREAQTELAGVIDRWAGHWQTATGESTRALYRRFYLTFGQDTLTAMSGSAREQREMMTRVTEDMTASDVKKKDKFWNNGDTGIVLYEGEDDLSEKDASVYLGKRTTYLSQRRRNGSPVPPYVEGISKRGHSCRLYRTSDLDAWKVENKAEDDLTEEQASVYLGKRTTYLAQRRRRGLPVPPYVEGISKKGQPCKLYRTSDLDVWKVENEGEDGLTEEQASVYLGKNNAYLNSRRRKGLPVPPYVEGESPKSGNLCNLYKTSDLDVWKVENEEDYTHTA